MGKVAREVKLETEQFAWLLLLTADRTQARGSTVRRVVPRSSEIARELDSTLTENEILMAEEYLLDQGYIAPANIGLTWGTYTITSAGLGWLDEGFPWPSEASPMISEQRVKAAKPRPAIVGARARSKWPWWWRRVTG